MRAGETKMSLEEYYNFYLHGRHWRLSRDHLNQVLVMHGFRKLHRAKKESIMRCLESIELMPPARSTLPHVGMSSGGFLSADEIADDLEALGWKECPNCSEADAFANHEENPDTGGTSLVLRRQRRPRRVPRAPPADFVIVGKRPRSKLKRVSLSALNAALSSRAAVPSWKLPPPPLPSHSRLSAPPSPEFLSPEVSRSLSEPSSPSWEPSPAHC